MSDTISERLRRWGFTWEGLRDNRHGEWWLIAQMVLITAHLLPPLPAPAQIGLAWPPAVRLVGGLTFLVALALGVQGALNLGESLSPLPEPMPGAELVTSGAYGRCRHPLYQSLVLASLGVVLLLGSLLHLALLLALASVLSFKARREEKRLAELHPGYAAYRATTPAILPCVPGLDWRS
ncbi:MAG: methyltransferase [Synechococcaceae cyanobacterium]|nr:methyltransferase [Synechococcaceae cyanobacterium]